MNLPEIKKIYIVCPANAKTGGPELLHQLVYELNSIGKDASIVFYGKKREEIDIVPEYRQYISTYLLPEDIKDEESNLIIVPEINVLFLKKICHAKKAIWWLSVDNFFRVHFSLMALKYRFWNKPLSYKIKESLHYLKHIPLGHIVSLSIKDSLLKKVDYNFCQSQYAIDFCKKYKLKNIIYLSDYINTYFVTSDKKKNKENIILYNPKKGIKFTQKLIDKSPEFTFVPIENMTRQEVIEIQNKSKIYIDFGNFPGKDRLPREAALCDCIVITGKKGASKFFEDVPLEDEFKFNAKNKNIKKIKNKFYEILADYEKFSEKMDKYKKIILNEKSKFEEDVKKNFLGL